MKAVVLAGGRNQRYKSHEPKPLMTIGERPVILDALDSLDTIGFPPSDVMIVTNPDNLDLIQSRVGRANFVIQHDPQGPAQAVDLAYQQYPALSDDDNLLVVQADDSHWITPEILQELAQGHDRTGATASMALIPYGNPLIHKGTYNIDPDGIITRYTAGYSERRRPREGYNLGAYIVSRTTFLESFSACATLNTGIPDIIKHIVETTELPVYGPVFDTPYVSANTTDGRDAARYVAHIHDRSIEELTEIARKITQNSGIT